MTSIHICNSVHVLDIVYKYIFLRTFSHYSEVTLLCLHPVEGLYERVVRKDRSRLILFPAQVKNAYLFRYGWSQSFVVVWVPLYSIAVELIIINFISPKRQIWFADVDDVQSGWGLSCQVSFVEGAELYLSNLSALRKHIFAYRLIFAADIPL